MVGYWGSSVRISCGGVLVRVGLRQGAADGYVLGCCATERPVLPGYQVFCENEPMGCGIERLISVVHGDEDIGLRQMISPGRVSVCAIFAFLLLSGCGEQELSSCLASTEQVVLLRQMAMTPEQKKQLDLCVSNRRDEDYCRGLHLNADTPVRICMADKGYTFTNEDSGFGVCRFFNFRDPKCYQSKWFLMLPASIRNGMSKPYVPS